MEDCIRIGATHSSKQIDIEAGEEHVWFATNVDHGVGSKARNRVVKRNDGVVQVHQTVLEWTGKTIVVPSSFRFEVDPSNRNLSTDFQNVRHGEWNAVLELKLVTTIDGDFVHVVLYEDQELELLTGMEWKESVWKRSSLLSQIPPLLVFLTTQCSSNRGLKWKATSLWLSV